MQPDDVEISPDLQRQFKTASVIGRAVKEAQGFSKYLADAAAHVNKLKEAGAPASKIMSESGGLYHVGPHGDPVGILPHNAAVREPFTLTKETPFNEIYQSKEIERHMPYLARFPVRPNPELPLGRGNAYKDRIEINPDLTLIPDKAQRLLAHEGSHVTASVTDPSKMLVGNNPENMVAFSKRPLIEQLNIAQAIRGGRFTPPSTTPAMKRLLEMGEEEFERTGRAAETIKFMNRPESANVPYRNTLGEIYARYLENPESRQLGYRTPQHTSRWGGPRIMHVTPEERIYSQAGPEGGRSILIRSDIEDFVKNLLGR